MDYKLLFFLIGRHTYVHQSCQKDAPRVPPRISIYCEKNYAPLFCNLQEFLLMFGKGSSTYTNAMDNIWTNVPIAPCHFTNVFQCPPMHVTLWHPPISPFCPSWPYLCHSIRHFQVSPCPLMSLCHPPSSLSTPPPYHFSIILPQHHLMSLKHPM